MKTLPLSAVLLLMIFSFGCKDEKKEDKKAEGFVIEGKIENGRGMLVTLARINIDNKVVLDTDTADLSGNFRLEGFEREKFIGVVSFDLSKSIFVSIDTASRIKLEIPEQKYENYKITGSPESIEFKSIKDVEVKFGEMMVNLRLDYQNTSEKDEKTRDRLRKEYEALVKKADYEYIELMRKSKSPLIQLFGLYNMQLPYDDELKKQIFEQIKEKNIQNNVALIFSREYQAGLNSAVGVQAPEITLADTAGKYISLNSLKGKVVLLDFWASWCGPCRQENPFVVEMYKKYQSKGFEIYGVSLDDNPDKWKKAIREDSISWPQVSDLGGWRSAAALAYSVKSIPGTFLIDREGKIIAKNLRGADLENKLKAVLN